MRYGIDLASEQALPDGYVPHEHEELRQLAGLVSGRSGRTPDAEGSVESRLQTGNQAFGRTEREVT